MLQNPSLSQQAADRASKEWLKEYLTQTYGISFADPETMRKDLVEKGTQITNNMIGDEFLYRLMSRFNDLDFSPSDGFITLAEVEDAIVKPKLHFDQKDILLLGLLKKYFNICRELSPDSPLQIGRTDIEALAKSLSVGCTSLKKRIDDEMTAQENLKK